MEKGRKKERVRGRRMEMGRKKNDHLFLSLLTYYPPGRKGRGVPNFCNKTIYSLANILSSRFQKWIQLRPDSQCLKTHPRGRRPRHSVPSLLLAPQYTSRSLLTPLHPPAKGDKQKEEDFHTRPTYLIMCCT